MPCASSSQKNDYVDRDDDPYAVETTRFFRPSHLNQRIIVQNGWFSVHRYNAPTAAATDKAGHFSTLEKATRYTGRITKITIPPVGFSRMRSELDRLGINEASLFPDLDGLSRHLNWSVSPLSDEIIGSH